MIAGAFGWGLAELRRMPLVELVEYAGLAAEFLRSRMPGRAPQ